MMMNEGEDDEERETPSKARGKKSSWNRRLYISFFIAFFSIMVFFCSLFLLSLLSNFEFSRTTTNSLSFSLSLSLLPPRFRMIKPLLSRNNNENESNSQRKLAHARLSRRRGIFLLGNVRPSDWIVQTERLPGRHRVRLEKSVRRSSEKNESSGVDVESSR